MTYLGINISIDNENRSILKSAQFELEKGTKLALIGPNGAGKSSLLSAIIGDSELTIKGQIQYKNHNLETLPIDKRAKLGIGIIHQDSPVLKGISLSQIMKLINPETTDQDIKSLAAKLNITHLLNRDLNSGFSGGEKRRAELAQVIIQDPDLVLIDELDSGVDVDSRRLIYSVLADFLTIKTTIIVSHDFEIFEFVKPDQVAIVNHQKVTINIGQPDGKLSQIRREGFN